MRRTFFSLSTVLLISLLFGACDSKDENAIISGGVTESASGNAIQGAIVEITEPAEFSGEYSQTDSLGNYSIGGISISDITELNLTASATDFENKVRTIRIVSGDEIRNFDFQLTKEGGSDDDGSDDDGGGEGVTGDPKGAAAIILDNVSNEEIRVQGTGGKVSSQLTFVVQDSAGRVLNTAGAVDVKFSIISGPSGGEQVIPDIVKTNSKGIAVTNIFSGDSSGVVRIRASVERNDVGLTIASEPILIAISGGFPNKDRFFIAPENYNLEGYGFTSAQGGSQYRYTVTASLGDLHGNPVQEGTAVGFKTEKAGNISGSSVTDTEGLASVSLRADGSTPTTHPRGPGFFTVIAHTYDENNNRIEKELDLLFSTRFAKITINDAINIPPNGAQTVSYSITDKNGNPMAAGSEVSVTASQGIDVIGGSFNLPDCLPDVDSAPGCTDFSVTLTDSDDETNNEASADIKIKITTPNGNETLSGSN